MSDSGEKRRLSGLARSIDALFTGESMPDVPEAAEPPSVADEVEPDPSESEGLPEPPEPFESGGPSEPGAAVQPAEPAERSERIEPDELFEPDERIEPDEPFEIEPPESQPAVDPSSSPEDVASAAPAPDPAAFVRALDDFLGEEPGADEEVLRLARELRDRFALDPLADAVERLVWAAGDPPDASLLGMAITVINPAVASRIVQRIGRERDEDRRAAYRTLCRRLGRVMAESFRGALTDTTDPHAMGAYRDALIAMGDVSRPIIEGMVGDENRLLVRSAVAILGEVGGEGAVELVTSALADTDPRIRSEAIRSLAKLGGENADQLIIASLDDSDSSVRVAAAEAAGDLGVERALRPLLGLLEGEQDPDVVLPLVRALGEIGDPGAVLAIEKHAVRSLFYKPTTQVRAAAYRALHRIGTPHARELIHAALEDKDIEVRAVAEELVDSGPAR
ncbi:MAG TPA: HEAT repeat domain-containing protein [Longimicrobiales bacterium]|nr:HEAT repeat domain-containing protein [Longimicrobiales bacterium]